ncbi:hypothetical protein [Alkaliphilus peptidifermentans]|uniref:hypothetical protein n=1 Tax=Alkaliphilus peptidifermentans TaxID=426129 RepID=UPI000B834E36|nr:hypothetical protein [Alkaliphilus peptidifermentans]
MKNKLMLIDKLPIDIDNFHIRKMNREDIDLRTNWPNYPSPYEMFDASYKNRPSEERDERWKKIKNNEKLVCLAIEHPNEKLVGIYYSAEIDWEEKTVNNMTVRLHPNWCDKGIV